MVQAATGVSGDASDDRGFAIECGENQPLCCPFGTGCSKKSVEEVLHFTEMIRFRS